MPARRSLSLVDDPVRHLTAGAVAVVLTLPLAALAVRTSTDVAHAQAWVAVLLFTFWYGLVYLLLCHMALRGLSGEQLRAAIVGSQLSVRRARLFSSVVGGSSASIAVQYSAAALVGVVAVVVSEERRSDPVVAVSAVAGTVGAWVLMTTAFASRYAALWAHEEGLEFDDVEDELTFGDFGHLSVQVSTAFGISGARLTRRAVRRLAMVHALVAFAFSTIIVALVVALIASVA